MKLFQRRFENFRCENCGELVEGNGYTNHCHHCLYSKHVDKNPGDRSEECGGLMKPIGIEIKDRGYIILHRCEKCGAKRRVKASKNDNMERIIELAKIPVSTFGTSD